MATHTAGREGDMGEVTRNELLHRLAAESQEAGDYDPPVPGGHTPGRVEAVGPEVNVVGGRQMALAADPLAQGQASANARRLAACWNAASAAGLTTEALEGHVVADLLRVARLLDKMDWCVGYEVVGENMALLADARDAAMAALAKADSANG